MTETQARRLLPHTVVMWDHDADIRGTVAVIGDSQFAVIWSNGRMKYYCYDQAHRISLWAPGR